MLAQSRPRPYSCTTVNDLSARLQDALGREFRVERELPLGGLGRLFLATDPSHRQVVVQVLPPDIAERLDTRRFLEAVERASRLRHPQLEPVLSAGATGDLVWCVLPRPHGESVRFRLHRDGGLTAAEVTQVLHDVADALAYGHEQGLAHGDVKPDNIVLVGERAVLAEYGLRAALSAALGGEGASGQAADVHALAVAGQQMLGGADTPVAKVLARALSIDPGEHFASAEVFRDAVGTPPSARRLRARRRVVTAVVLLGLLALMVIRQIRSTQPLDPGLIAVAPFEVLDPAHGLWREGLVTLLSANLDGAGPLRTVSPTVVVRTWENDPDARTAVALGERTGAGVVLLGRVVRVGGDSVRITASLVDAEAEHAIGDLQVVDHESRIDYMGDQLTVQVLAMLGRTRPIGAVRRASLGTSSLAAVKAYLLGEQFYRRSEWDSAIAHYRQAIELDSTFALALYRAGIVLGWQSSASDTLSTLYLRRAAAHNRGLPTRESLLVASQGLQAALEAGDGASDYWRNYRRLYATVDAATRRYPRDPEAWHERGEVRYHYPAFAMRAEARLAFDHAIILDSGFAPAYVHGTELALRMGDRPGALRYLEAFGRLASRDTYAGAARLTLALLDPRRAQSPEVQQVLDSAGHELLTAVMQTFRGWPDTNITGVRLLRTLVGGRAGPVSLEGDPSYAGLLVDGLTFHGMLDEAWRTYGQRPGRLYAALAWAGGVPEDSAAALFDRALHEEGGPLTPAVLAAPWWQRRGDRPSLQALARIASERARTAATPRERLLMRYGADVANAFLALASGDTARGLAGLAALPDTVCSTCELLRVAYAWTLVEARRDSTAHVVLGRDAPGETTALIPFWELARARLAVRERRTADAITAYRFVRDAWHHADPTLQPWVREAVQQLRRLE